MSQPFQKSPPSPHAESDQRSRCSDVRGLPVAVGLNPASHADVTIPDIRIELRWRMHRRASIKSDHPTVFADGLLASDAMDRLSQTGWDIVIFDGAPGAMELTEDAIKTVDLVVCPLRAADQDLGSTEYLVSACLDFREPLLLVINSVNPRARTC